MTMLPLLNENYPVSIPLPGTRSRLEVLETPSFSFKSLERHPPDYQALQVSLLATFSSTVLITSPI